MNGSHRNLRKRLSGLKVAPAPDPWTQLPVIAVGGLAAVGFSADSAALLVVSTGGGRSLYDSATGDRLGRDRDLDMDAWLSPDGLSADGIADYSHERFGVSGIWGGGLPNTGAGWSCSIVAPDWPNEVVVLQPPGADVRVDQFATGCVPIADSSVVEIRAAGFSWDGSTFVVATSADMTIWRRRDLTSGQSRT